MLRYFLFFLAGFEVDNGGPARFSALVEFLLPDIFDVELQVAAGDDDEEAGRGLTGARDEPRSR